MASQQMMANAIRALAMDAVEQANSGHPGMPMGMADVAAVLFNRILKYDAATPRWPDRDRFVLSAGHGSMLLYACLHLAGYQRPTMDDIRAFRQLGSPCAGHPEFGELEGIETTTGPLGQGLATAVGMAIAERRLNAEFGDALVDHRTYVIAGDGCLMEGISQEAISLAGHLRLNRLVVLWDDNGISIDGATSLSTSDDMLMRFTASGWATQAVDGHDPDAVEAALRLAQASDRPSLIACRTIIGFGAPTKAGSEKTHGSPLGKDEIAGAREKLGWTAPPFEVPADVLTAWRAAGARGAGAARAWQDRLAAAPAETRASFERRMAGALPEGLAGAFKAYVDGLLANPVKVATRKASEMALEVINRSCPETLGGSADLTGSNNTRTKDQAPLSAANPGGRYAFYGIREFGMAAAMNGMALHGGLIPYGGTFLVFADYCRAAIRLSALQHQRVVYVLTHDSIGLGEDGPTHQPVEHLASLRAMPNLHVFRPADVVETAECWQAALERRDGPSVLALSRQNLPQVRREAAAVNLSARGGYVLAGVDAPRLVLIATGSEVSTALDVQALLAGQGIAASVVSMPCTEAFDAQDAAWREAVLPAGVRRAVIEAGSTLGWHKYAGPNGLIFGIDRFGASAPAEILYDHFGLTPKKVAEAIVRAL